MTQQRKILTLTFFTGFQVYHALIHAYLGITKTKVKGHPAEWLGFKIDPKFHAISALANAAIAISLGMKARQIINETQLDLPHSKQELLKTA